MQAFYRRSLCGPTSTHRCWVGHAAFVANVGHARHSRRSIDRTSRGPATLRCSTFWERRCFRRVGAWEALVKGKTVFLHTQRASRLVGGIQGVAAAFARTCPGVRADEPRSLHAPRDNARPRTDRRRPLVDGSGPEIRHPRWVPLPDRQTMDFLLNDIGARRSSTCRMRCGRSCSWAPRSPVSGCRESSQVRHPPRGRRRRVDGAGIVGVARPIAWTAVGRHRRATGTEGRNDPLPLEEGRGEVGCP